MANFDIAFKRTAQFEGGYVYDPDDNGGETYAGISRKANPKWVGWKTIDAAKKKSNFPKNLKSDIVLQTQVKTLYKTNYWNTIWGDKITNQDVANDLYDTGVNMGVAMSAGLLILLAGHKRYAMKYSTAMIHSGSGGTQGTYKQCEEQQKNYKKLVDMMRNYILERTNIEVKLFKKQWTKDWYLTDKEQVELGIVSKIVENLDEII